MNSLHYCRGGSSECGDKWSRSTDFLLIAGDISCQLCKSILLLGPPPGTTLQTPVILIDNLWICCCISDPICVTCCSAEPIIQHRPHSYNYQMLYQTFYTLLTSAFTCPISEPHLVSYIAAWLTRHRNCSNFSSTFWKQIYGKSCKWPSQSIFIQKILNL